MYVEKNRNKNNKKYQQLQYDHFIVVATSFRLRFLTSTARMRRAAKFFIWLC